MTKPMSPGSTPVSTLIGGPVVRVTPDVSLRQAAQALTNADVGIVVVGDGTRATGVVSERDITKAVAGGLDLDVMQAVDITHKSLQWSDASATVAEVAAEMMDQWVRHVLVEQDGRLVGVVSARDLLGLYLSGEEID
jgi:CBS domain-containing protein